MEFLLDLIKRVILTHL